MLCVVFACHLGAQVPGPTGTWNVNASGDWSSAANWTALSPGTDYPSGVGATALVFQNITGTRTITLDVPVTLGTLQLGDTNNSAAFILSGGTLTFDNGGMANANNGGAIGAFFNHNSATSGLSPSNSDRIDSAVTLNDILTIDANRNLEFRGAWDGGGNNLIFNSTGRLYWNNNSGSNNGVLSNVGTLTINEGEVRFDGLAGGAGNLVGATNIVIGNGVLGTGTRAFARLFLVNTEVTQTANITLNGGWFVNDLGNNNQTFSGNITLIGAADMNIIDLNDPGSQEEHLFTGVIGGAGGFSKVNTGAMILQGNNTFSGNLYVQRGRGANLGSVHLSGLNGAIAAAAGIFISRDGSLYLDNSIVVNNNRVGDTTGLTLRGGARMRFIGNGVSAVSETMGAYLVDTGAGRVNFDLDDTTPQSLTLSFATFGRSAGAVAQFQVLENTPGAFGTTAQLRITDAGASAVKYGGGGTNGTTNMTLVVGAFGGVNDISNHFMTFDSATPTLLRPLDFNTEYLLSQNLIFQGVAHTLNCTTLGGVDQNLMINYNTARAVSPDPQVDWYAPNPIRVTESIGINSLRFGTNTPTVSNNTNELGSTLSLYAGVTIYLGDSLAASNGLGVNTNGSGMILFGRDVDGGNPNSNQFITGGVLDFGSREAILVNESGNNAFIRSDIRGTGGLTKAGAQTIYLDNTNSYSGVTTIAEGILVVRDQGALGQSTLVQIEGGSSLYLELGTVLPDTVNLRVGVLNGSRTVLRSNAGNNTFNGAIIIDNVDNLGNLIYTPNINVNNGDTLNLNGKIYGALASNPLSQDITLNDARIISTNGSGAGIININGVFQDNIDGAGTSISRATENELLRFQITGNDQVIVNVRQQWNAAGNILLERGYLRYEGTGNFWTDDAAGAISPTNSQSGMRISGSTSTSTGNINLVLTKAGQKLNIDRIDIGANGSSNNYNNLGNITLAGTNTSGEVTFGNGTGIIFYNNSDATRAHSRDLTVYAAGGGTVNLDFRLDENDADVHSSFTKIGRGVVNYRGDNTATNGDVEQLNLSGGLLRLTNYGGSTGTRFDNGAMIVLAGGGIEMDAVGSLANETANYTGSAVVANATVPFPTAQTIISAGGTDVIVTSDTGRTTTMNIGSTAILLTRLTGGTVNFVENANGGTSVITLNGSNAQANDTAIAWATYGDSYTFHAALATYSLNALDFAMTTGGSGDVVAFAGATRENTDDVSTWTLGNDVSEGASGFSGTTTTANVNTIHFDRNGINTLTLGAGGLVVNSGGIMINSLVSTLGSTKTIAGGTLTAGVGKDLIIHHYGVDTLTIASILADNGTTALVKTGGGDMMLSGNNTYAGGTFFNGGVVTISSDANLGAVPGGVDANNLYFNGGALRTTADMTLNANRGILLGGNGGEFNVTAGTTLTYGGFIDAEPNLVADYVANPGVGRLDKTGAGTLLWTNIVDNNFAGLLDIKAGTLSWAPTIVISNNLTVNVFGTNNAFLDGTIVRSGATLDLSLASVTGTTGTVYLYEWLTFEAGSTLNIAEDPDDNRQINLRGPLQFNSLGLTGAAAATIVDVNRNTVQFNEDGGFVIGDGGILKTGAGNLYFREHSPDWTGQLIIAEGAVYAFSAGTPLGVGTAPILLGRDNGVVGEPVSGNAIAALYFRDEGGYRDVSTLRQDIIVRSENGGGTQVKRIGALYLAHMDVVNFDGNITLNDDVEFYFRDDTRNSGGTSSADIRNDNRSNGAPTNAETAFINFNGNLSGTGNIFTNIDQGGNGNARNGSIIAPFDDIVITAIFGLNGDNTAWTGDLTISNDTANTTSSLDDVDRNAYVRLGNILGLNNNRVFFGSRGNFQMGGISKTFTQNFLFIGGTGLAITAGIENAANTAATITFDSGTQSGVNFQDIGVGLRDGSPFFVGGNGALNVAKIGSGDTVFGASTGGGDVVDAFSSYTGTTLVQAGRLIAGANNSFSPYSRFIVSSGATLSLNLAGVGFINTIGSLSGVAGSAVNIDNSVLNVGGDGTSDANFAGVIGGFGDLVKIGSGAQQLSGVNTFSGSLSVRQGALIGGNNTAFGDAVNVVNLGGIAFLAPGLLDARVELLLAGTANAMATPVIMNNFDGNDEGITVIGTRATSGTYGFTSAGTVELYQDYSTRVFFEAAGSSVFQFGGAVQDIGSSAVTSLVKVGSGTVEFHAANTYGASGVWAAGAAINGGTVIRHGTLSVFNSSSLGSTVVELGDTRRDLAVNAFLATTAPLITREVGGSFDPLGNGLGGAGNGAFMFVKAVIDGVQITAADIGKRILVKDEGDAAERNGVYVIVSLDAGCAHMNLVRAGDFDQAGEMLYGTSIGVDAGITQSGLRFFMAAADVVTVNGVVNVDGATEDPVHWLVDEANPNVALVAGASGLTIATNIDINDTNGTGRTILGGSFTTGTTTFSGAVRLQHSTLAGVDNIRELTLTSASNDAGGGVLLTGVISEAQVGDKLSVNKDGTGTVTLTNTSTYTGKTTVTAGTLALSATGGIIGTNWIEVAAGATFDESARAGDFTFDGPISGAGTVVTGAHSLIVGTNGGAGVLRPGMSSDPASIAAAGDLIGVLTVNGRVVLTGDATGANRLTLQMGASNGADFNDAANFSAHLGGGDFSTWIIGQGATYDAQTGGNHDRVIATGSFTLNSGGRISFTNDGGTDYRPVFGDVFNLLDWSSASITQNGFDVGGSYRADGLLGDLELPDLVTAGLLYNTSLFFSHGIVVVVPEPSRAVLLLVGCAALLLRRRRSEMVS